MRRGDVGYINDARGLHAVRAREKETETETETETER
jgi:hypothetical protein